MPLQRPEFFTWRTGAQRWRIGVLGNPDVTLVLGFNLAPFDAQMGQMRNAFLIALPAALLLIATGGWLLSQRALRPVRTLTETAERITAQRLDQRIPTEDEDVEFLRLVTVFNQMLDRLEKSFQQAVRFSADAAHELKTPLTILQGELEQALQSAPSGSDEQRVYNTLLEEVQRLKAIVRKLLLLSQADAGRLPLNQEPIPLSETLEALYEDTQILAPHLTVEKDLAPDLWVLADPDLLRQVLQNLTSNAIKYNRDGGVIRFHLRQSGPLVRFTLANTGEGIPPEDRDKIFDRFYRADKSRGRRVDGVGLGLSLAREIVRAHAGDLVLEDREDGLTAFTVTLPAAT
jgi:heavy metal sensor kinase